MTLSRWLRDYLYIPLGGNRGGTRATYRNLFLTMLLGGLWHGAAWTFVVWGAIHGSFLVLERVVRRAGGRPTWAADGPAAPVLSSPLRWLLTFNVVCLAWVFFRADSLGTAFDILGRILSGAEVDPTTTLVTGLILAVIGLSLASQFVPPAPSCRASAPSDALAPGQGVALAAALTVIDVLGPDGVAPFIYFQF